MNIWLRFFIVWVGRETDDSLASYVDPYRV